MTTSDLGDCVIGCIKTPGCLSINSHNADNVIHCELNKSNRYGSQANLIKTSFDRAYLELISNHWPDACFQKDGWYRGKSAAYKFVQESAVALEARQRCNNMSAGADLVSFADKEEEQIFDQYIREFGKWGRIFIGLNDIAKEGTFIWFDGTKSEHRNWKDGEPNNDKNMEDCAAKFQKEGTPYAGQWNDIPCDHKSFFACKTLCM
ncbi:C-type lectin BML-2 [Exaiptasia diaphana]|nr:C-type lectin BML-2 [Exaiptasia diaphana]